MINSRLTRLGAGLAAGLAIGGCAYDDYGNGYGGSVSAGYGSAGYYDDDFSGQDYGYGYGWYDGFYYPGYGVYVYDNGGGRRQWRDRDRDHWRSNPRPRGATAPRPGDGNWRGPRVDGNVDANANLGSQGRRRGQAQQPVTSYPWQAQQRQQPQQPATSNPWQAQQGQQGQPGSRGDRRGNGSGDQQRNFENRPAPRAAPQARQERPSGFGDIVRGARDESRRRSGN